MPLITSPFCPARALEAYLARVLAVADGRARLNQWLSDLSPGF
jgi:hypothetical protein